MQESNVRVCTNDNLNKMQSKQSYHPTESKTMREKILFDACGFVKETHVVRTVLQ